MADLTVDLCGIKLVNPVVTASGTFGYGREYIDLVPFEKIGAITVKGVSPFRVPWTCAHPASIAASAPSGVAGKPPNSRHVLVT